MKKKLITLGVFSFIFLQNTIAQGISQSQPNLSFNNIESEVDTMGGQILGILRIVFLIFAAIGLLIVGVNFFSQRQQSKASLGMFLGGLALYLLFTILFP